MKRKLIIFLFLFSISGFSTIELHKFYVSIYQINFNQKEKRLEITSRIFLDDINEALKLKYNKITHLSTSQESKENIELLKKLISENFSIKINGVPKSINYLSNETEANVLICYFNIKEISQIKSLEIKNTLLFDLNSDQQNIIQTNIYKKKQTLLLTQNNEKGFINPFN